MSRTATLKSIQPTTLSTKREVPFEIPKRPRKKKRRLKSADVEDLECGEESYDVKKRTNFGQDMLGLSDDESRALSHSDNSPPPMNSAYNTTGLVALTPTRAPEIKFMVLGTETQTNTTTQFQLRPASFVLSFRKASLMICLLKRAPCRIPPSKFI
jgi:hypothetical protein